MAIVAPDLMTAMRYFVGAQAKPGGLYFVSIDHSPSEQLGNDCHTMALVISQSMEHQKIADELAQKLNRTKLKQWKEGRSTKAKLKYKRDFQTHFFHVLKNYPVLVVIFHAKEVDILKYEEYFVRDIGAAGAYIRSILNDKISIGPVILSGNEKPLTFEISVKHAPMIVYTVSNLLRIYDSLLQAVNEVSSSGSSRNSAWIQIWSDRPPNDFHGPYAEIMRIFLGGSRMSGNYTWGGFTHDDNQQIDLLVDNLAGLFHEICNDNKAYYYQGPPLEEPIVGVCCVQKLT